MGGYSSLVVPASGSARLRRALCASISVDAFIGDYEDRQQRLGHSTAAFTLDIYSHAVPSLQAEAAAAFGTMVVG